jgi:hypothetical protein
MNHEHSAEEIPFLKRSLRKKQARIRADRDPWDPTLPDRRNKRFVDAEIPGARLVALERRNHVFLPGKPATERFSEELELFLQQ